MADSSTQVVPHWSILTSCLCALVAAELLFFGLYGGTICALIAAAIILIGSSVSFAAIPAMVLSVYSTYEGVTALRELWPWNSPYEDYSYSLSLTFVITAFLLVFTSVILVIFAVAACVKAPTYMKQKELARAKAVASSPRRNNPQVIVSEYQPRQPTISPMVNGGMQMTPSPQPPTPSPVVTTMQDGRSSGQIVSVVPVVLRSASGKVYTDQGIMYSSPEGKTTVFANTSAPIPSPQPNVASPLQVGQNPYIVVTSPQQVVPPQEMPSPPKAHVQVTITPQD